MISSFKQERDDFNELLYLNHHFILEWFKSWDIPVILLIEPRNKYLLITYFYRNLLNLSLMRRFSCSLRHISPHFIGLSSIDSPALPTMKDIIPLIIVLMSFSFLVSCSARWVQDSNTTIRSLDTVVVVTDTTLIGKLTENDPKSTDSASRNIVKNMSYRNHDEVMIL